jgi:hypothetical protein
MPVTLRITVLWDVKPCSLTDHNQDLGVPSSNSYKTEAAGSSETLVEFNDLPDNMVSHCRK